MHSAIHHSWQNLDYQYLNDKRLKMSEIKIKLFAIAKDEAAYIPQWVFHHFYFGFDEIEIWLNGITDNSVEVCELLRKQYRNFSYQIADDILDNCIRNGEHFQRLSYNIILNRELNRGVLTHILFLDLDEYWTPKDFQSTIKHLIFKFPNADTISLSWYTDNGDYLREPFGDVFNLDQEIVKHSHFKSILRLSSSVIKADIHNHYINNGSQIDVYGKEVDISANNAFGAYSLSKNNSVIDDFFIFHCIFKSELEYVSSLLRSRKHTSRNMYQLKDNRWGYIVCRDALLFSIDIRLVKKYLEFLYDFYKVSNLNYPIVLARKHIESNFLKVVSIISNTDILNFELKILNGVKIKEISKIMPNIKFCIDKISVSNLELELIGWLVDLNSKKECHIEFYDVEHQMIIDGEFQSIDRPDVIEFVDKFAPLSSGFRFSGYLENNIKSENIKVSLLSFNKKANIVRFGVKYK